jgi:hypothetical protein
MTFALGFGGNRDVVEHEAARLSEEDGQVDDPGLALQDEDMLRSDEGGVVVEHWTGRAADEWDVFGICGSDDRFYDGLVRGQRMRIEGVGDSGMTLDMDRPIRKD